MKILLIGDPHLKITKFDLAQKFLSWVNQVIKDQRPDMVINLGDTFHTHAVIRSEVVTEFKNHVSSVTELGIPYYYILGNHDCYKPDDSKYHALQPFDIENFHVIDEVTDVGNMTMVPYIHDFDKFPTQTKPICIAHQQFVGCDYGYYRPDIGVDADKVSADIIISGHIHKRQMFGKVIYPGTPFAQSVNDIDESKGVMLFDSDTYEYSFIESPLPLWKGLRYNLVDDTLMDIARVHHDLYGTLNNKDYWVVEITGPKSDISGWMSSVEFDQLRQGKNVEFRTAYTDKEKQKIEIKAITAGSIMRDYLDKIYKGSVDKGIIYSKALEILEKQ